MFSKKFWLRSSTVFVCERYISKFHGMVVPLYISLEE